MVTYVLPLVVVEIREYLDLAGRSPFAEWFDSLNAPAAAKITTALVRLEQGIVRTRIFNPLSTTGRITSTVRGNKMPLTRSFKQTVQSRIEKDPEFREELLREGVECLLSGDLETGKAILRDYINATIGFERLGGLTHKPPKSLMRMLGPRGNPQARNLFEVIGHLQKAEGLHFRLSLRTLAR
jgi:hypothetical protein